MVVTFDSVLTDVGDTLPPLAFKVTVRVVVFVVVAHVGLDGNVKAPYVVAVFHPA